MYAHRSHWEIGNRQVVGNGGEDTARAIDEERSDRADEIVLVDCANACKEIMPVVGGPAQSSHSQPQRQVVGIDIREDLQVVHQALLACLDEAEGGGTEFELIIERIAGREIQAIGEIHHALGSHLQFGIVAEPHLLSRKGNIEN